MNKQLTEAIAKLGSGQYKDGSSAKSGWLYQPMGDVFPPLRGVPCHCAPAVRHTFGVINACPQEGTLIDIGCATGYYVAKLSMYKRCVGFDADENAIAVARLLNLECYHAPNIGYMREALAAQYEKPLTILALNVHMWWHKQGIAEEMMTLIANAADRVFFQTAGLESRGRYRVPELVSAQDERAYLSRWFESIELVDTTSLHGGVRRLWLLK